MRGEVGDGNGKENHTPGLIQKESCQKPPETHKTHILSVIGGTEHVLPDKWDNSGIEGHLVENMVTLLVVQNEDLGFPKLWSPCQVVCREQGTAVTPHFL